MPNRLPKATTKITASALEDQPDAIAITLSGSDQDGTITGYALTSLPTNGTLYIDANATTLAVAGVTYASNIFYFLPGAEFSGKSSFAFKVVDNLNAASASPATVTIDVAALNDAPVADLNGSASGNSITLSYAANDPAVIIAPSTIVTDIDSTNFGGGSIRVSITQNGTTSDQLSIMTDSTVSLAGNGGVLVNGIKIGTLSAAQNGSNGSDLVVDLTNAATPELVSILLKHIAYSNSSADPGTAPRTVTFTLNDGDGTANGGQNIGSATALITFPSTNDAPEGADKTVTTAEDTAYAFAAADFGFTDEDAALTAVKITTLPGAGTLLLDGVPIAANDEINLADIGDLTFAPGANASGTGYATFQFLVKDSGGLYDDDANTITIDVTGQDDGPTLANEIAHQSATEDSTFSFTVPADTFADADSGPLTLSATKADGSPLPDWLEFNTATGEFTGTPLNGDVGTLSVKVTATDDSNASVSDVLDIVVTNTNDAPLPSGALPSQSVLFNNPFLLTVGSALFADVDVGDVLTWSAAKADGSALPAWLSFDAGSRTFSGTPGLGDVGTTEVRITVTDLAGANAHVDVPLTVLNGLTITGTANGETLNGTIDGELIDALGGNDSVFGGPGADVIHGGPGVDTLRGEAGADVINGGDDGDNLQGGDGTDILNGDNGNDSLSGGNDSDSLNGGDGIDNLDGGNGNDTLDGGADNDNLNGGSGNDTLNGGDGNDSLNGNEGDILSGGAGTDTISFDNFSSIGSPTIDGGADADTINLSGRASAVMLITTGTGADIINLLNVQVGSQLITVTDFTPGAGGDKLGIGHTSGGILPSLSGWDGSSNPFGAGFLQLIQNGADTELQWDQNGPASGGSVWQTIVRFQNTNLGDFTSDNFTPAYSPDGAASVGLTITGTANGETLNGTIGDDLIDALGGNDSVFGGPGADVIHGGPGVDTLRGEAGADVINGGDDGDNLQGGDGTDLLNGDNGNDSLSGGNDSDSLNGGDGIDNLDGGNGNDTLDGGADNDNLNGGSGNDTLNGGDGNDSLNGNEGDILSGGAGTDTISFDNFSSIGSPTIDGGADADTINLSGRASAVMLITTGAGADIINLLNVQVGSQLITVTDFTPGAGGDKLGIGHTSGGILPSLSGWDGSSNPFGAGFLQLIQNGADTELQWDQNGPASGGSVWQTIVRFQNTNLGDFTSDNFTPAYSPDGAASVGLTITGTANGETLNGTIGDDLIDALGGNDSVFGGPGADVIHGGPGVDTLRGEAGADVINGGDDGDNLQGGDGTDILNGDNGNDSLSGGNDSDSLNGGDGIDNLDGGNGNDTLDGGADNDNLNGGSGNDTLNGGDGNDSLNGNEGDILSGGAGTDTISFDNFSSIGSPTIDGGADADTINLSGRASAVMLITTGTGADIINLLNVQVGSQLITVTDFTPGAGGDKLGIGHTSGGILPSLSGWDGSSNPFGAGFLQLIQNGADTELQWDQNGPASGGSVWQTIVRFQNTNLGDFTSDNFTPAYSPDGSGILGTASNGTGGPDAITGGIGDDFLSGDAGNDTITGGNGVDTIDGGNDDDTITGGFGFDELTGGAGADTFVFTFASQGADTIIDFASGTDTLQISAAGFGGGLTAGMDPATVFGSSSDATFASASERFHYDTSSDTLYFDADGSGTSATAVVLVQLLGDVGLQSNDFLFV